MGEALGWRVTGDAGARGACRGGECGAKFGGAPSPGSLMSRCECVAHSFVLSGLAFRVPVGATGCDPVVRLIPGPPCSHTEHP